MPQEELTVKEKRELEDLRSFEKIYQAVAFEIDRAKLNRTIVDTAAKHLSCVSVILTLIEGDVIYADTMSKSPIEAILRRAVGSEYRALPQKMDKDYTITIKAARYQKIYYSNYLPDAVTPPAPLAASKLGVRLYRSKGVAAVPVILKGESIGVLVFIFRKKYQELTEREVGLLKKYADFVALGISQSNLYEKVKTQVKQLETKNKELDTIFRVTNEIVSTLDPTEVAQRAANSIPKEMGYLGAIIDRYNEETGEFLPIAMTETDLQPKLKRIMKNELNDLSEYAFNIRDIDDQKDHLLVETINQDKGVIMTDLKKVLNPPLDSRIIGAISKLTKIQCVVGYPIKARNKIIGVVVYFLNKKDHTQLSREDHDMMRTFAFQVGIGLENADLYQHSKNLAKNLQDKNIQLEHRNHELDTLFRITNEIVTTLDAKIVAQRASNLVAEEMGYIGAAIISKNKTTARNEFLSLTEHNVRDKIFNFMMKEAYKCSTDHRSKYKDIPINENNFVISESLDEALPILMPDEDEAKEIQKLLGIKLIINAPIKVQNEVIGLVSFFLKKESEEEISSREFDMMQTFAFQVGIGLENARLFKELEELSKTLAEKNLQLEEYAKKEKDILDIMGHELRTPITIVRNSLAFLKTLAKRGKVKAEKLNHYIDVALRSARREINIIETMLSATKVEGGKIEIFRTKVDSKDVIDEALIGQRENIKAKDLELKLEVPEDIPPIYADRSRVQEIIDNFLSNAVKYTKEGSVTIKAEEKGSSVQFSVIDTGYGMTEEQMQRLGTKFYRVKQHVNDDKQRLYNVVRPGGTGLGLYVTFNLVKLHGGKVDVESEVGKGSTFKFTIPKYVGQESEVDDAKSKDLLQEYRKKRKGDQVSDQ